MVGRTSELRGLADALASCRSGIPRTVVVTGEAGIGKTRLVSEFVAGLPDGVAVAQTNCLDGPRAATPLAPVRRLLARLADRLGPAELLTAAGPAAAVLEGLLAGGAPTAAASSEQLSEVLERTLRSLSRDRPLVLVLHDLHRADESTLALARSLVGELDGCQLMLLLTRRDEASGSPALRALLNEIELSHGVIRLDLERLGSEEVGQMVGELLDRPVSDAELAAIVARSEGVPLFVEELAGLPTDELPGSVREMVLARRRTLPPPARHLVDCLTVGGQSVDHQVLETVASASVPDLPTAIRAVIDAGLVKVSGSGYAFRHSLFQETLYAGLMPADRLRWHGAFATAFGDRSPSESALAAQHWIAAGEPGAAAAASLVAAAACRADAAFDSAARFGEYVDTHWPELPDGPAALGLTRWQLRIQIADDWIRAGVTDAARRHLHRARYDLPPGNRRERARLALNARRIDLHDGRTAGAADLGVAYQLLEGCTDPADLEVAGLVRIFQASEALFESADLESADRLASEAADVARAVPAGDLHLEIAAIRSYIAAMRGDADAMSAHLAAADPASADTAEGELRFLHAVVVERTRRGDRPGAYGAAQRGLDVAGAGYTRRWGQVFLSARAEAETHFGDWPGALADIEAGLAQRPLLSFRETLLRMRYLILVRSGAAEDAATLLREEAEALHAVYATSPDLATRWQVARSEAELALGDPDAALRLLDPAWSRVGRGMLVRDAELAFAEARALAASARGREAVPDRLERLLDALPAEGQVGALALAARAELAGPAAAALAWQAAAGLAATLGPSLPVAFGWYVRARAALGSTTKRADTELADVRAAALQCGHRTLCDLIEVRSAGRRAEAGVLTPREREVLGLLATGLSNRAIGERLGISHKTVGVHVSSILGRLGVASRTEAAVWAERNADALA